MVGLTALQAERTSPRAINHVADALHRTDAIDRGLKLNRVAVDFHEADGKTAIIDHGRSQGWGPGAAGEIKDARIGISDLVDIAKELVDKVADFLKIIELHLLGAITLLGGAQLLEDAAHGKRQNQQGDHHFQQRKTALSWERQDSGGASWS